MYSSAWWEPIGVIVIAQPITDAQREAIASIKFSSKTRHISRMEMKDDDESA